MTQPVFASARVGLCMCVCVCVHALLFTYWCIETWTPAVILTPTHPEPQPNYTRVNGRTAARVNPDGPWVRISPGQSDDPAAGAS